MNRDCTVLVTSCDAYRDVEEPFLALFRRHWPDCPFELVLLTETQGTPGFDRTVSTGKGKSWSQMLVEALDAIDTPYVMMLMNDYFLEADVDTALVLRRVAEAKESDALNYRLNPNPPRAVKNTAYCVSCQAGIWNRKFLRDLAARTRSAWEFERYGSVMFDESDTRPLLVTKTKEFPFLDVVHKGYWEPWGVELLAREKIDYDFSVRGTPPLRVRAREWVKRVVFLANPDVVTRIQNRVESLTTIWSKVRTWGIGGIVDAIRRRRSLKVNRARIAALLAKGPKGEPERGITVIADLTWRAALSKSIRDFVTMLKLAGIPVQTYDTCLKPEIPEADCRGLLTPKEDFDIYRYTHTVELYRSMLPDSVPMKKARVVFHDSAAGILEAMPFLDTPDSILAMSDFNFEYFRKALPRSKVHKIVYPLLLPDRERTPRDEVRAKYGIGAGDFVVFFNFDFGSYYRKNPTAAMRAFAKAFPSEADAKLVFKTKNAAKCPSHVKELESLAAELGISDRFIHLSAYLPRRDVDGLTDACDVYLSLHKSEGFGIGIAEAMSLAHPAVVTDWSATTEFCHPDNSMPIPYRLVPIKPWEYVECLKEWADADVDAAAAALRRLKDDPSLRERLGLAAQKFISEHFSLDSFKASVEAFLDA